MNHLRFNEDSSNTHICPISVSGKERVVVLRKEGLDVVEASDLELLRLLLDDLAVQRVHQRRRVQEQRPVRKIDFTLTDRCQVVFGKRGLQERDNRLTPMIQPIKPFT